MREIQTARAIQGWESQTNQSGDGAIAGMAGNSLLIVACSTGAAQTDERCLFFNEQNDNEAQDQTEQRKQL